jgi:hypothetical protein
MKKNSVKAILACDKDFNNVGIIKEVIRQAEIDTKLTITEFILGYSNPVDTILVNLAKDSGLNVVHVPTEWDNIKAKDALIATKSWGGKTVKYNKNSWRDRNTAIIDIADLLICVGFQKDILEKARAKGIKIYEYKAPEMADDDFDYKF